MQNYRLALTIMVGKTVIAVNRFLGKKGTSLPGIVAMKFTPELIKLLRAQHKKVIAVTGTNGKTTTSNLLAGILMAEGVQLTHNSAGANMVSGIATAFIEAGNLWGQTGSDIAVIEIDEATMPKVIPMLEPDIVVVTNFFRDQLDRYGELDKTIDLTVQAIDKLNKALVILNADDPLVATIGKKIKLPVKYYGVEKNQYSSAYTEQVVEGRYCPFCEGEYQYEYYQYGQLGSYSCPQCGYRRPEPDYLVKTAELSDDISFTIDAKGKLTDYRLSLQGFYNLYNALAAVAAATELGVDTKSIKVGLEQYSANAGRMEKFKIRGRDTTLTLVKNPTGFNEVLKTVVNAKGNKGLVIAINDLAADGRDISWLWDVDFEILTDESVNFIVCSGLRAEDLAVRLKYANVPIEKILLKKDLNEAITTGIENTDSANKVFVLPTYTNLFAAEDILNAMN